LARSRRNLSGGFEQRDDHNRSRWRFSPVFMPDTQPDTNSLNTSLMNGGDD
jgi:hypothetical protein